jgi:hypothetical protein
VDETFPLQFNAVMEQSERFWQSKMVRPLNLCMLARVAEAFPDLDFIFRKQEMLNKFKANLGLAGGTVSIETSFSLLSLTNEAQGSNADLRSLAEATLHRLDFIAQKNTQRKKAIRESVMNGKDGELLEKWREIMKQIDSV